MEKIVVVEGPKCLMRKFEMLRGHNRAEQKRNQLGIATQDVNFITKRDTANGTHLHKREIIFPIFCWLFSFSFSQLQSAWTKFSPRMMAKTMYK